MIRRPPRSTRTDTLCPSTTLFRSPGGPAGDGRTLLYIALPIATMRTVRNRGGRTIHMDLKDHIRHIPDFPKPGILFYDISTLLAHPEAWAHCVDRLTEVVAPHRPQVLAGVESRGFLVAAPLARSEARRAGTECVSTCRSRWSPEH